MKKGHVGAAVRAVLKQVARRSGELPEWARPNSPADLIPVSWHVRHSRVANGVQTHVRVWTEGRVCWYADVVGITGTYTFWDVTLRWVRPAGGWAPSEELVGGAPIDLP